MSNDHKESGTICAWCHPGLPGNHGICERHARQMRRELRQWNGHRRGQVWFSLAVLAGCLVAGLIVGAAVALWEAASKGLPW